MHFRTSNQAELDEFKGLSDPHYGCTSDHQDEYAGAGLVDLPSGAMVFEITRQDDSVHYVTVEGTAEEIEGSDLFIRLRAWLVANGLDYKYPSE